MTRLTTSALVSLLAACSGTVTSGDKDGPNGGSQDLVPPTIEIEAPARGTIAEGDKITVIGRVSDAGSAVTKLQVNGQDVALNGDKFTVDLTGVAGINLIETTAVDVAGNQAVDDRSVLMGTLADQGTQVDDAVVAKLDSAVIHALGDMVTDVASNTDYTALLTALNPVVNDLNGCDGSTVNVETATIASVPVTAEPTEGGIRITARIENLHMTGNLYAKNKPFLICLSFNRDFTVTSNEYVASARLVPTVAADGTIQMTMDQITTSGEFAIDVDGGFLGIGNGTIESKMREKIPAALQSVIQDDLPEMAENYLAEFVADDYPVTVLGQTVNLKIKPTSMSWDATGGRIAISSSATVAGVEGAMYLSNPSPAPAAMGTGDGLSIALADDLANQMFAGMWASGALEFAYHPGSGDPLQAFFPDADLVKTTMLLPPVVKADGATGEFSLSVGDTIVQIQAGDKSLAELAINAHILITASISAEGKLTLKTGKPVVHGQVVSQSPDLPLALDPPKVAAFTELAVKQLAATADDLFDTLPVPGLGDVELQQPTVTSLEGYVVMGGSFAPRATDAP